MSVKSDDRGLAGLKPRRVAFDARHRDILMQYPDVGNTIYWSSGFMTTMRTAGPWTHEFDKYRPPTYTQLAQLLYDLK